MKKRITLLFLLLCLIPSSVFATVTDKQLMTITSSADGSTQHGYYFTTTSISPQPLVVSLHVWGGDYKLQKYSLQDQAKAANWNWIMPDFRGQNNKYDACGSPKVVADIDDAIDFMIKTGKVDANRIYVVGASGGGHATLVSLMKSKHKVNSYIAWVPITDLKAWYYESLGRKNDQFAQNIKQCTGTTSDVLKFDEIKLRSPLYMDTPTEKLATTKVKIFAGIHDGYGNGLVPITQSIKFYNKLVTDLGAPADQKVPLEVSLDLMEKCTSENKLGQIGGRDVHLFKQYENVQLTIFEGGHEMLEDYTMSLLK